MAFLQCNDALFPADVVFEFTLTCRSTALIGNYYSDYQLFLYQTISEHREKGITFYAIAELFNKEGYLTVQQEVQRDTRPFNLEEEISKGKVAKQRASTSVVRLHHGGGG